jgi:tetratricopeptide (TPR) repeat protein
MAIAAHPGVSEGYAGAALVYRDRGDVANARRMLETGNEAAGGASAELHYFLGLTLIDAKNYEKAQEHARRAYELGYPLPGLANKLAAVGYPLD